MGYCSKCGNQISDGTRFCPACGAPFSHETGKREVAFEGTIHKCPNCGQVLETFSVTCPSCGYELRDIQATASLRDLSLRLQEIGAHSDKSSKRSLLERLRHDATDADDRAVALIRAFPIPNTREDLIEFIIVSASNVNVDAFNEWKRSNLSSSEVAMSNAWMSKLEQAYQKASITLNGDDAFEKIKALYDNTMKKVTWAKRAMLRFWVTLALIWFAIIAFCLIMAALSPEVG